MTQEKRRPVTSGAASKQSTETTVIVTRRLAPWRQRRRVHLAVRELDALLGCGPDPWSFSEPIDWHAIDMDKGVPERDFRGRELLAAGWLP